MASVEAHYQNTLAPIYCWAFGGIDALIQRGDDFFTAHGILPKGSGVAVDLGAGPGSQTIPLARRGFKVTAIDLNSALLRELENHGRDLPINVVIDDLCHFTEHCPDNVELIVCMADTLLHLPSVQSVQELLKTAYGNLEIDGRLIITVRDLTNELRDEDRFIPIRQNACTIASCFLEYETDTVKVHDLIYQRSGENWALNKSFYRKLRLSQKWLEKELVTIGFKILIGSNSQGLITLIATKI